MKKNIVPQNYTLSLALSDAVPVIFFGLSGLLLWKMSHSLLIAIGSMICFVSGMLKVLWKIIVAARKKNVWLLFIQLRYAMPVGFVLLIVGFVYACMRNEMTDFFQGIVQPASLFFLILSIAGMVAMMYCAMKLDSVKAKTNWIEQTCNTVTQGCFFLAIWMAFLAAR